MHPFELAGRRVGDGHPVFVIAEAGVNHNGSLSLALELVDAAAQAGADAVKFQTFHASELASPVAPKAEYQTSVGEPGESQLDMLRRLELSFEDHRILFAHARSRGLCFLSTPFEESSADFLDQLGVEAFKLSSGELTNPNLLAHVATKGRPMLVSTGMATLEEVSAAVEDIRAVLPVPLILLHCVSRYPAEPSDVNLRAMGTMRESLGIPVGFSDHTMGLEVALAAVALGAVVIEKHLTLDRSMDGPDHRASMVPGEFRSLVAAIRVVESSLGDGIKRPCAAEAETAAAARKSITALADIPEGTVLTVGLLGIRRPGTGVPPRALSQVIGRRATRDIVAGTPLGWDAIG